MQVRVSILTVVLLNATMIWFSTPGNLQLESEPSDVAPTNVAPTNWRVRRNAFEGLLADDLQPIAEWCRNNSRPELADETLRWYQDRDLKRQYIFIPSESGRVSSSDPIEQQWQEQLNDALDKHAERIFELAKAASQAEAGAIAYQLLHEVLFYNPDHEQVREILGHRKNELGWRISADRIKLKRATRPHPTMDWPAHEYLAASTPHFNIASQADEQTTRLLAEKLERWQGIWRQVFFEYWNRPKTVARWIEGKGKSRIPPKKFDIVFFADQQQYIDQLSKWVKGIEGSSGYYNDSNRTSFFYASNELNTWRHEVTHQLFQESIRTTPSPFDEGYIWLGEGIAMYFESLSDFGPYVTLGGFESRRLQYARLRRLREGFYVPMEELAALGRKKFQLRDDVARLYSQSAGITHMLMDGNSGASQDELVEFLKLMYLGKLKPGTFESVVGRTFKELDEQYVEFLKVAPNQVEKYLSLPGERRELALPAAKLDDNAFKAIGSCRNLEWLDLTANRVTGKQIKMLAACERLTKLFLTNCAIDSGTLQSLEQFGQLQELDLSGSSVSDSILAALTASKRLTSIRLANTNITDSGLRSLAGFSQLSSIDVSETGVTDEGVDWLKSQLPDVEITRKK